MSKNGVEWDGRKWYDLEQHFGKKPQGCGKQGTWGREWSVQDNIGVPGWATVGCVCGCAQLIMSLTATQSPVSLLRFPGKSWRQGAAPQGKGHGSWGLWNRVKRALNSACPSGPGEERLAKEQVRGGDSPEASRQRQPKAGIDIFSGTVWCAHTLTLRGRVGRSPTCISRRRKVRL